MAFGAESSKRPPIDAPSRSSSPRASDTTLEVAGSGSNLPLTRKLLEAWNARTRSAFVMHASIGSTGAVQAVRDRAVHIGLLSRPLSRDEREGPAATLAQQPYAWSIVVFAAHPAVRDRSITGREVTALVRGEPSAWSDGASRVFLSRERGDSSHRAAIARLPGFREAEREAQEASRFRVLYSDAELRFALLGTVGSVGLTDLGAGSIDHLPLVALALDGVEPTKDNASSGRYPLVKPFVALVHREPHPLAESFLRFLRSPEARTIVEDTGFLSSEPAGGVP